MRVFMLTLVVMLGGCANLHFGKPSAPAPEAVRSAYSVTRDIVYTPAQWPKPLLADVYRPEGVGPFPSVLLIHGGAWKRGDRAQVERLATRIADRGYLVVNITYRLLPDFTFPAQLKDVQQAVLWMRSKAGRGYGIDPTRIGTFGYSAGAHLGSLVGGVADHPTMGKPGTRIKAIVAGGNPADLSLYEGGYLVPNFLGGQKSERPDVFRAASPITYVKKGHPPVFQYHATLDDYVPFVQAENYKAALDKAGVPNELYVIRGHGHITGFFADGEAVERAIEFLDRYLR